MREIKFRGKVKRGYNYCREWLYGSLIQIDEANYGIVELSDISCDENGYIDYSHTPVQMETVGQFTGLLAKNHKRNLSAEIYEDDVFRHTKENDNGDVTTYSVVMWIKQLGAFYLVPIEHYNVIKFSDVSKESAFSWLYEDAELRDFSIDIGLMKVGNIHDNPELLTSNNNKK